MKTDFTETMLHLSWLNVSFPNIEVRDFISIASLTISILTAYWNILRGSKFRSPPLRFIVLARWPGSNTCILNFPVSLTNIGGRTGVIDSLYADFINLPTRHTERFYCWQEALLVRQDFKGVNAEVPTPIALKAGESVVKNYIFFPDSLDFMYERGRYKLILYANVSGYRKPIKLYEQMLDIKSIVAPSSHPDEIPFIWSYKLSPTEILEVSDYGNSVSPPSVIQVVNR